MNWYDFIAPFYDLVSSSLYANVRRKLVERMELQRGDCVLLIACGTGLDFDNVLRKIGTEGKIIAIDNSNRMLERARRRCKDNGWRNVIIIEADIRDLSAELIKRNGFRDFAQFDSALAVLAFSVIPDWKNVMSKTISLLKPNARLGVLDGYRAQNDMYARALNLLPKSEISRPIQQEMKQSMSGFETSHYGLSRTLFIASATANEAT